MPQDTKSVFVAITGKPNVGKSSLLNRLINQKIAIVSNKPQTTRNKITGILTQDKIQYVFIDTPGFHKRMTKLSDFMLKQINESVKGIDLCLLLVDARSKLIGSHEQDLIQTLKNLKIPIILVLNKIDKLKDKSQLISTIELYSNILKFDEAIPISVNENDGIDILLKVISQYTNLSPHFFPEDLVTDQMERFLVSEIVREKILRNIHDEIPHGVAVVVESMKERQAGKIIDIDAYIYCEKYNHKGIIIGKGGKLLKKIATESRIDIERLLSKKINLKCWIKVKDNWRNNDTWIKNLGYIGN